MMERGPRIFLYPISPEEVTLNLAATLALFEPCLTEGVGDAFADLNREFLSAFAGIEMNARSEEAPEILEVPAEMIKNGDTFNIMRLDGLDPMIAWAMGAATGHTAVAIWRDDQLLTITMFYLLLCHSERNNFFLLQKCTMELWKQTSPPCTC